MISGSQTLATIDQAVGEARSRTGTVEEQIAAVNGQLAELSQAQARDFKDLARLRLGHLADSGLVQRLDEAEQRASAMLAERVKALQDLKGQLDAAAGQARELAAERAAQAAAVDAAAQALDAAEGRTQGRLETDPAYAAQRERAREAERTAAHADEKATRSAEEREQKGAAYRADPLFMYLWERQYGTDGYRGWGLTRWLDGKVSRLIGFADARANYARLNEIPERLREHADALKAQAEHEFSALKDLDEAARTADGIAPLAARLEEEQARLDAIDQRISQAASDTQALEVRKALFAAGEDPQTRQAVEYLATEFQRDDLMELRREALATPFLEDDAIVARLMQREDERRRLEASLQGLREVLNQHRQRLDEAEALRADFKRNRYDRAGSSFGDEALISMMLGQFINGILDRQNLSRILKEQHRYRPERANPDFGSGGFGRGTVWGGGSSGNIGSWGGGGGGGGGGFRTGGGF